MKKLHLFLLLLASVFTANAQTVAIDPAGDGGFESGSTFSANGWTVVNASSNDWVLGSGAGTSGGSNAAYISNDGSSYAYAITTAATSHFYRDVTIPTGATGITLSFQWKGMGQSGFDRLLVYTAPTSVTPVANMPASSNSTISGATLRFTQPSYAVTAYGLATVSLPSTLAGTTVRLIFTWQNNSTLGTSPGAAVDDISLSYCNLPAIGGPTSVCAGSSITLTNTVTGGSWSSSMPSVGSIDATSGILTGIAAGNTTVTYTSGICTKTATITVKALPAAIGGTKTVCEGATTTLTNAAGGTWSSSNTSAATINISGVVTGIASGTSTIVYTNAMGCSISDIVTVNPVPGAITGSSTVCIGATTTLSCTPTGGMWVSGTTAKATIGLTSGDLTGVSSGTSNITYISSNGCRSTQVITVNILPAAISGITTICVGSSVTMTNTTMGGLWSCSAPTIADVISTTGLVAGLNVGNATISYTNGFGCSKTLDITVNAAVPDISGSTDMCTGTIQTLTDATSGGTWSSSAAAVASITGAGVLSALTPGTTNITYTVSPGCKNVLPITVNSTPPAIGGTMQVCEGGFTAFVTNTLTGGSWSSSNPSIGSVDATTGQVTGLVAGTTTIVYSMGTSCSTSKIFTVNPTPGAITGNPIACIGSTTTLIPATLGGATWTSSNTTVATVGVTSGVVSGLVIGTSTITYALTTGCYTTFVVTATPTPATIVGANFVCIGEVTTLTDTDPGGTWSSSNAGKATVGSSSGIVTGVTTGTTKISYTIAGCSATKTISVNSLPAAITGTAVTCVGGTTTLAIATTGGTWSSSAPTIASVGTSGIVTGQSSGTATISYTNSGGCSTTATVTVNPATPSITGPTSVCAGSTIALSIATTGGTWSSSTTAKATISATGIVTGVSAGTTTITYAVSPTCRTTTPITVNAVPAAIAGTLNVCVGVSTTVTDATTGGTWSTTSSILTIGSATGIVTGATAGTATITYMLSTGCYKTATFTVKAVPGAITGASVVCPGNTIALSDPTSGGASWTSSTPAVATVVSSTGIVTGVSNGTTTITYTLTTGCYTTKVVSVNPAATAISGTLVSCGGTTQTLSNTGGGSWSSSNTSVATIGSTTGIVSALMGGTSTITYTLPTGCYTTAVFTVNSVPVTISGASSICVGSTTTLTDATAGGTWVSGTTPIATVGSNNGLVTAISTGVATISYVMTTTGCYRTTTIAVNPAVPAISGSTTVCTGTTTMLSNATSGGLWTSSNTTAATVVASTGSVAGIAAGNTTITYTVGSGCYATYPMTVNQTPAAITGLANVCEASTITLSSTTSGAVWSSSNTAAGTVNASTGVVSGIAAGSTTISYTLGSCSVSKSVSVNPLPSPITGTFFLCSGTYTVLSSFTALGTSWSSSNTAVGTIGVTSGGFTALSGGTTNITYTTTAGCYVTQQVTVVTAPPAIGGAPQVCIGSTNTLTNAISGGTWISSNTAVATVGSSTGVISGLTLGTSEITYTLGATCIATVIITVNPLPNTITGTPSVCETATTTLANTTVSGTWSSSNTAIATVVSGTGVVTGVLAGNANISYIVTATGCYRSVNVTVNAQPAAITGTMAICAGATTTLANTVSGGVWSSSNTAVGTVNSSTGVVAGITAGTTRISYTLGSCFSTAVVTVNPLPNSITGTLSVCETLTTTLANTTPLGTWTSSNTSAATVVSGTGVVTGVLAGNSNISYTITATGCYRSVNVTVNAQPAAITGTMAICAGASTTLANTVSGGVWSSSNTAVGTVNSSTGLVDGITAGTTTISYTLGSCFSSAVVTVNPLPNSITGTLSVCETFTTTLGNTTPSGTWSSSNTSAATVVSGTGVVTGVLAGNSNISYTITATGCYRSVNVTVNAQPAAITGTLTVCAGGATTALNDATSGGVWTSSNTAVGTVNSSTGLVTGLTSGTTGITYTLGSCFSNVVVTVNPLPNSITGTFDVCETFTTDLDNTTPSGTWSSSNASIASVVSGTGVVTGVLAGNANISFTITATGCYRSVNVTVNAQPAAISGTLSVCESGGTTALGNTVTGGVWSSSNTAVGTVNSSTGVVTGIVSGTTRITYTLGSCFSTAVVIVNALPNSITGTLSVCETFTTALASTTPGGTWSSSTPAVGSVNSSTGVVAGISAGNTTITYTVTSSGCLVTAQVTVNTQPAAITGTATVCSGNTTALNTTSSGGAWSSSNTAVGTVSATGIVSGLTAGTTTISYTIGSCAATRTVTVNATPNAITGTLLACEGNNTTLSSTTSGGTWTSSTPSVATIVSGTGVLTGVLAGNTTITYTVTATGCFVTAQVTVTTSPAAITGTNTICQAATTTLGETTSGGTWQSSNAGVATVGSTTGLVTGVSGGNVTISYVMTGTGCYVIFPMTINALPATIGGTLQVCEGSTTTLTNSTSGGTWSSSNTAAGTVNSATGVVAGIAAGNTTISYIITASGCYQTAQVTVNARPSAITGTASVCVNSSTTLSSTPSGGTWTSSTPANGTVDASTGVVTGIASGNTTITYTLSTGCLVTRAVTVNPLPNAITGTQSVCVGLTTTLGNTTPSGTWSSSTPAIGTVNSATGVVAGISNGNTTISYTITATGCYSTAIVTVNPNPGSITGTPTVCVGYTTTLGNSLSGGTWSGTNNAAGTVDASTGIVTGIAAGTTRISYIVSGCFATQVATVLAVPAAIGGTASVCEASSTTLTDATASGTWTSSNTGIATTGSSGSPVTWNGIAQGNATITYTIANGCFALKDVTVNQTPTAFSPSPVVCVSSNVTLTSTPSGGTWTSSNATAATVGSATGILGGVNSAGSANISYTLANGCRRITLATVNALPNNITSSSQTVCEGGTLTYSNTTPSGTWSSASTSVATVGSATGIITGVVAGNTSISYTITATGCAKGRTVTVNAAPTSIGGSLNVCNGLTSTLSGTPSGGTWTSANTGVATVGSSTGIVTGQSAGTTDITYTSSGCTISSVFTVTAAPATITPTLSPFVCVGFTTTLSNTTPSGTWTTGNAAVATVGSTDGVVTGVSGTAGTGSTATISYTISTGCSATRVVTVFPNPSSPIVSAQQGTLHSICVAPTQTHVNLSNASGFASTWMSSNTAVGTVGSTNGVLSGITAGTTIITFTQLAVNGGCYTTTVYTVNAASSAGTISGPNTVIIANQITLASTVGSGGTWTSSTPAVGSVASTTGVVTGVAAGTTTITYTFNNGCGSATSTYTVSVTTSRPGGGTVYGGPKDPAYLSNVQVYPNPNNGSFIINGEWSVKHDEEVTLEVRDMLGRLIYDEKITTVRGGINHNVSLGNNLARGMYVLTLRSEDKNASIHFVVGE